MDSERPAEPGSPAPHCVVWHARGVTPPANLMSALQKRHVHIEFCTGPFGALAAACALDRAGHSAPPTAVHAHGVILVLVQPAQLDRALDVVRCLETYTPRAMCWRYDAVAKAQLRAIGSAELEAEGAPAGVPARAMPEVVVTPPFRRDAMAPVPGAVRHPAQGRPSLRLAGDGVLPASTEEEDDPLGEKVREAAGSTSEQASPSPGGGSARQVLTQEELSMLLGEDTLDARTGRPPKRTGGST